MNGQAERQIELGSVQNVTVLIGMPKEKRCSKCRGLKAIEAFSRDKSTKDGLKYSCKDCNKDISRKWRTANPIKAHECEKRWRKENPDKKRALKRKWYNLNKEKCGKIKKQKYQLNPEKAKKRARAWRLANIDRSRENGRKWRLANPKMAKERAQKWCDENPERVREIKKRWASKNPGRSRNWALKNPEKRKLIVKKYAIKQRKKPRNRINNSISALIRYSLKGNKLGQHWEFLVGYSLEDLRAHLEKRFKEGMNWENYGQWHIDHKIPISVFNFEKPEDEDFKRCWALKNLQPLWAFDNIKKSNKLDGHFQPALIF